MSTCISSPAAGFSSPSSGSTTGRRRARLGPSPQLASLSHFRLTLEAPASSCWLVPALPNKRNTVSRVRTVVPVNTSSTSPSSRKVSILMPCGTLLFQPRKNPCKAMGSRLPRPRGDVPNLSQTPDNPREATNLVSLSATSHIQLCPAKARLSAELVPPRVSVQALFA